MGINIDLVHDLQQLTEIRVDPVTRLLYSTDASIYQIEPLGVAFPRTRDDLAAIVELCARYRTPLLARGSGSSLAGQAIGPALIIDCTRYLNHILEINPDLRIATVEPGVIVNALNVATAKYGLQFGPDPASAERATMGGSIANNATGAHSILYGMASDHLLEADVLLGDGSAVKLGPVGRDQLSMINDQYSIANGQSGGGENSGGRVGELYRAALNIREKYGEAIKTHWPATWRRASGYGLNYLLTWSPGAPDRWAAVGGKNSLPYPPVEPGTLNLAPLLAGSEGTLAVIRQATVRLVPLPKHTVLGILAFNSLEQACDAAPGLLERQPSAIELIPRNLVDLARSSPSYARLASFLDPLENPEALLVVEFAGDDPRQIQDQARALGSDVLLAVTPAEQKQVWGLRKAGLGILNSRPGDFKPVSIIEDLSVPVNRLGDFVRGMQRIMEEHATTAEYYAHASAGCLHIRPLLNIKTATGVQELRSIAEQSINLTLSLGGAPSGEHGDGLARGEWLERTFGHEILDACRELKNAFDPQGLLNPGKKLDVQPMDVNLRYGVNYQAKAWLPVMDFSLDGGSKGQAGLLEAIEQCNGAGVCRKADGVMCPSFRATQEEMHSTRGRANLLRAMASGRFPAGMASEQAVRDALDLCLACKGCKAECPSGVDVARLKYEFFNNYYKTHRRHLRDYLFGYIGSLLPLGAPFSPLVNWGLHSRPGIWISEKLLGLARQRPFPKYASWGRRIRKPEGSAQLQPYIFLADAFNRYFYPQAEEAALRVIAACGYRAHMLPALGAGRTLISKGFLDAAQKHAASVVERIYSIDPDGLMPVVGLEPSEIYTLRDEYPALLSGDPRAVHLARRSWMVDEFLLRPGTNGAPRIDALRKQINQQAGAQLPPVLVHGHCYQKAQPPAPDGYPVGPTATLAMLKAAGYAPSLIDAGCCGMAGAFGYEKEHYDVSMKVGEDGVLPAVRQAKPGTLITASGVSCQAQIEDGAGRQALHPIVLVDQVLKKEGNYE